VSATVEGRRRTAKKFVRYRNAELGLRFVEFESAADLKTAVEKLDGRELKGSRVTSVADVRWTFHL
jgi:hypothetical protein